MAITLDSREWDRTIVEYAAASGKTFAESQERFILKLGIFAAKIAPVANRARIRAKRGEYKLIAWLARRRYGTAPRVARLYKQDRVSVSAKGRRSRRKSRVRARGKPVSYTQEEARQLEKTHMARRASSVGFLRNFFRVWIDTMRAGFNVGGRGSALAGAAAIGAKRGATTHQSRPGGSGFRARFARSVGRRKSAGILVSFDFRSDLVRPAAQHARDAERKLQSILDAAVPAAVRDTIDYIERKQGKLARGYSAK